MSTSFTSMALDWRNTSNGKMLREIEMQDNDQLVTVSWDPVADKPRFALVLPNEGFRYTDSMRIFLCKGISFLGNSLSRKTTDEG